MHTHDIVLISDNAEDLQLMLNCLNEWCSANSMSVNASKSYVIHFRPNSVPKINSEFRCGTQNLIITDRYTYLGITLNEFLDFSATAKAVVQSASRALGLLIAKFKSMDGMPYDVYTKLYDTMVWPVINYGVSVWGIKSFSRINAVQNRAMRFSLAPDVNQRLCHFCNVVEDEIHVILNCSAYDDLINNLFIKAVSVLPTFNVLDANEKMKFLFTNPDMIRTCAKTCFKILQQRNSFFYK